MMFANCSEALGLAYIASTTRNDALSEFPITDTYGAEVFVGKPMLHIRVPSGLKIQTGRDRRYLNAGDEPEFFITSARDAETRNNVLVQASTHKVQEESASERVTRVLFAHLNSLLFAHSQFVKTGRTIGGFNVRNALRGAIAKMMGRFGRFAQIDDSVTDKEFADGVKLFAKAHAGRIDELLTKLQDLSTEWNKPTTLESFRHYFKGVLDLIVMTTAKAVVETTMKLK